MTYIQIPGLNEMRRALGAYERARSDYSINPTPENSRRIDRTRLEYEKAKDYYEAELILARTIQEVGA